MSTGSTSGEIKNKVKRVSPSKNCANVIYKNFRVTENISRGSDFTYFNVLKANPECRSDN